MDRLCDDVLQLIFFELADPSALSRVSTRLRAFSQDPYVRAHYFLTRYGPVQALYYALARGKLITDRVLDILIASGAHLSRYLIQVAFHHFFYTQSHFIKSSLPWVRNVPLATFSYFLKLAAEKYGDIPRGKGEDDGALFATFIKEAKFPPESQRISWEMIKDIFENYNFIPFCNRDPLMAQFPLALAIEPRLLPYAVANGFQMDSKYRDFVFRKMFERSAAVPTTPAANAAHADEIVSNVKELCRLDPAMFVTRTVAAEVCLEAKTNEPAYSALKQLDRYGHLPFALSALVQDLLKLFLKARGITTTAITQALTLLYTDFLAPPPVPAASASSARRALPPPPAPAPVDPTVRLVMLLTVFAADTPVVGLKARLAALRLGELSRCDAVGVLCSPFVERHAPIAEYLRREAGLSHTQLKELVEEVAVRCLEIESKGKTLKKLNEAFPSVRGRIVQAVLGAHAVRVEDVPDVGDDEARCVRFRAKLGRPMAGIVVGELDSDSEMEDEDEDGDESFDEEEEDSDDASSSGDTEFGGWQARRSGGGPADGDESDGDGAAGARRGVSELGSIGLENLTTMIRRDELQPGRGRRRIFYHTGLYGHPPNNSRLPADSLLVGKWIKSEFGAQSSVTATFFTHAIINSNNSLMHNYLLAHDAVPITFKHFRILARLGRARVDFYLYERIKIGAPFYATEDDYVSNADAAKHLFRKLSKGGDAPPCVKAEPADTAAGLSSPRGRKRPRRSTAATVASYAVPDSDDEAIAEEEDAEFAEFRTGGGGAERRRKMVKVETHLERWIKALGELFKEEQRKYREKKKRVLEKAAEPGVKIRVPKNEFFKSLGMNLRLLRQLDTERRMFRPAAVDEAFSDDEDDEYVQQKASRAKRRKTT